MWHFFPAFFLYQPTLTDKHSSASPRPQRKLQQQPLPSLYQPLRLSGDFFLDRLAA